MSYLVLYRKHRPQTFADVMGQKVIIQTLKNAIRYQKINHCYLFSGNKGTGKTTLAKIFAKAINCQQIQQGDICNKCPFCKSYNQTHIDIIEIDGASCNGVDEIRELQDKIQYKAHTGKYKVYIIDEVHVLTPNAFNALLKILEDPPEHIIFILITTELHKIPDTVFSRAQSFAFENLSLKNIVLQLQKIAALEKLFITKDALKAIAYHSEGGMRDALSLLDQISSYQNNLITAEDVAEIKGTVSKEFLKKMFKALMEQKAIKALKLLNEVIDAGKNIDLLILDLISAMKEHLILFAKNKKVLLESNPYNTNQILTESTQSQQINNFLKTLIKLQLDLKKNNQKKIFVEIAFLQICFPLTKTISLEEQLHNSTNNTIELNQSIKEKENTSTLETKELDINFPPTKTQHQKKITNKELALPKLNYQLTKIKSTNKNNAVSIKNLVMMVVNIISDKDEQIKDMFNKRWHILETCYKQNAYYKIAADFLYKGKIVAISFQKEMILIYQDLIAFQQMLHINIKEQVLSILNTKSLLIKNYIVLLEKDWESFCAFQQNYPEKPVETFLNACDWDINIYNKHHNTNPPKILHPPIIQLAHNFFDPNIIEIIN